MSSRERTEKIERLERQAKREELFKLIAEQVEKLGYECVHVGLNNSAGLSIQILIDSLGGINLSDCENVSKSINLMLDKLDSNNKDGSKNKNNKDKNYKDDKNEKNYKNENGYLAGIKGRYYLEVSSPGIERPLFTLEHYRRFQGSEARLRLAEPFEGRKTLTGEIISAGDDSVKIYLNDEEREIKVPFNIIKAGNLKIKEGLY